MIGRLRYLHTIRPGELSPNRVLEAVRRRVGDVPHLWSWFLTGAGRRQAMSLQRFRGMHEGQRCVIIANGPSLKNTAMHLLRDEITIGMNRVHMLEETFGVRPNYAVVSDVVSQLQHIAKDLAAIPIPKFVNWNGRRHVPEGDFLFFKTSFRPRFSQDFASRIYGGHSVTFAALQLAYYMGFSEVILVGKDHSYAATGEPCSPVVSDGTERNHFASGYYAPGQLWRIPDYKGEEMAYRMAREAFEADGRRVLDATVGGKLEVFPKVELEAALK